MSSFFPLNWNVSETSDRLTKNSIKITSLKSFHSLKFPSNVQSKPRIFRKRKKKYSVDKITNNSPNGIPSQNLREISASTLWLRHCLKSNKPKSVSWFMNFPFTNFLFSWLIFYNFIFHSKPSGNLPLLENLLYRKSFVRTLHYRLNVILFDKYSHDESFHSQFKKIFFFKHQFNLLFTHQNFHRFLA